MIPRGLKPPRWASQSSSSGGVFGLLVGRRGEDYLCRLQALDERAAGTGRTTPRRKLPCSPVSARSVTVGLTERPNLSRMTFTIGRRHSFGSLDCRNTTAMSPLVSWTTEPMGKGPSIRMKTRSSRGSK